jgi:hypothetical protein
VVFYLYRLLDLVQDIIYQVHHLYFAALENLRDSEDIYRICENIKENIVISPKDSLGLYELKQHKLWFDENCSQCLHQRNQGKLQWLKDPNQSKLHNLNNVRRESSRHFRNKKDYLKVKMMNLKLTE